MSSTDTAVIVDGRRFQIMHFGTHEGVQTTYLVDEMYVTREAFIQMLQEAKQRSESRSVL